MTSSKYPTLSKFISETDVLDAIVNIFDIKYHNEYSERFKQIDAYVVPNTFFNPFHFVQHVILYLAFHPHSPSRPPVFLKIQLHVADKIFPRISLFVEDQPPAQVASLVPIASDHPDQFDFSTVVEKIELAAQAYFLDGTKLYSDYDLAQNNCQDFLERVLAQFCFDTERHPLATYRNFQAATRKSLVLFRQVTHVVYLLSLLGLLVGFAAYSTSIYNEVSSSGYACFVTNLTACQPALNPNCTISRFLVQGREFLYSFNESCSFEVAIFSSVSSSSSSSISSSSFSSSSSSFSSSSSSSFSPLFYSTIAPHQVLGGCNHIPDATGCCGFSLNQSYPCIVTNSSERVAHILSDSQFAFPDPGRILDIIFYTVVALLAFGVVLGAVVLSLPSCYCCTGRLAKHRAMIRLSPRLLLLELVFFLIFATVFLIALLATALKPHNLPSFIDAFTALISVAFAYILLTRTYSLVEGCFDVYDGCSPDALPMMRSQKSSTINKSFHYFTSAETY